MITTIVWSWVMIPLVIMTIEDEDDRSFMAQLFMEYRALMFFEIFSLCATAR
jgi:RNA polymerase sigma-70 factor (ECF subfamily)